MVSVSGSLYEWSLLLMASHSKSIVWEYFKIDKKDEA
jgi:hypothetical protein